MEVHQSKDPNSTKQISMKPKQYQRIQSPPLEEEYDDEQETTHTQAHQLHNYTKDPISVAQNKKPLTSSIYLNAFKKNTNQSQPKQKEDIFKDQPVLYNMPPTYEININVAQKDQDYYDEGKYSKSTFIQQPAYLNKFVPDESDDSSTGKHIDQEEQIMTEQDYDGQQHQSDMDDSQEQFEHLEKQVEEGSEEREDLEGVEERDDDEIEQEFDEDEDFERDDQNIEDSSHEDENIPASSQSISPNKEVRKKVTNREEDIQDEYAEQLDESSVVRESNVRSSGSPIMLQQKQDTTGGFAVCMNSMSSGGNVAGAQSDKKEVIIERNEKFTIYKMVPQMNIVQSRPTQRSSQYTQLTQSASNIAEKQCDFHLKEHSETVEDQEDSFSSAERRASLINSKVQTKDDSSFFGEESKVISREGQEKRVSKPPRQSQQLQKQKSNEQSQNNSRVVSINRTSSLKQTDKTEQKEPLQYNRSSSDKVNRTSQVNSIQEDFTLNRNNNQHLKQILSVNVVQPPQTTNLQTNKKSIEKIKEEKKVPQQKINEQDLLKQEYLKLKKELDQMKSQQKQTKGVNETKIEKSGKEEVKVGGGIKVQKQQSKKNLVLDNITHVPLENNYTGQDFTEQQVLSNDSESPQESSHSRSRFYNQKKSITPASIDKKKIFKSKGLYSQKESARAAEGVQKMGILGSKMRMEMGDLEQVERTEKNYINKTSGKSQRGKNMSPGKEGKGKGKEHQTQQVHKRNQSKHKVSKTYDQSMDISDNSAEQTKKHRTKSKHKQQNNHNKSHRSNKYKTSYSSSKDSEECSQCSDHCSCSSHSEQKEEDEQEEDLKEFDSDEGQSCEYSRSGGQGEHSSECSEIRRKKKKKKQNKRKKQQRDKSHDDGKHHHCIQNCQTCNLKSQQSGYLYANQFPPQNQLPLQLLLQYAQHITEQNPPPAAQFMHPQYYQQQPNIAAPIPLITQQYQQIQQEQHKQQVMFFGSNNQPMNSSVLVNNNATFGKKDLNFESNEEGRALNRNLSQKSLGSAGGKYDAALNSQYVSQQHQHQSPPRTLRHQQEYYQQQNQVKSPHYREFSQHARLDKPDFISSGLNAASQGGYLNQLKNRFLLKHQTSDDHNNNDYEQYQGGNNGGSRNQLYANHSLNNQRQHVREVSQKYVPTSRMYKDQEYQQQSKFYMEKRHTKTNSMMDYQSEGARNLHPSSDEQKYQQNYRPGTFKYGDNDELKDERRRGYYDDDRADEEFQNHGEDDDGQSPDFSNLLQQKDDKQSQGQDKDSCDNDSMDEGVKASATRQSALMSPKERPDLNPPMNNFKRTPLDPKQKLQAGNQKPGKSSNKPSVVEQDTKGPKAIIIGFDNNKEGSNPFANKPQLKSRVNKGDMSGTNKQQDVSQGKGTFQQISNRSKSVKNGVDGPGHVGGLKNQKMVVNQIKSPKAAAISINFEKATNQKPKPEIKNAKVQLQESPLKKAVFEIKQKESVIIQPRESKVAQISITTQRAQPAKKDSQVKKELHVLENDPSDPFHNKGLLIEIFDKNQVGKGGKQVQKGKQEEVSLAEMFKQKKQKEFEEKHQKFVQQDQDIMGQDEAQKDQKKGRSKEEILELRKKMMKSKVKNKQDNFGGVTSLQEDQDPLSNQNKKNSAQSKDPLDMLKRLAMGQKPQIDKKEMKKLTSKNYQNLPEIQKKKEEEKKKEEYMARKAATKELVKQMDDKRRKQIQFKKKKSIAPDDRE